MNNKGSFILKWTLIITFITIFSKVIGFLREMTIAYIFGANMQTDAYFVALLLPGLIFTAFYDVINRAFIPIYGSMRNDKDSTVFVNSTGLFILLLLVAVFILIQAFAPQIARVLAPGFSEQALQLTVELLRVVAFSLFFIGFSGFISGFLRAQHIFLGPALTGLPLNIVIITGSLLFGTVYGITSLAYTTVVAYAAAFLVMLPWVVQSRVDLKAGFNMRHRGIREMKPLLAPLAVAGAAGEAKALIDRIFASLLPAGGVSALNYAAKIRDLPTTILVSSLLTVLFPTLVDLSAGNKAEQFNNTIIYYMRIIFFLIMPVATLTLVLGQPIVRLVFERGAFTEADTIITASTLIFFSIGMIGNAIGQLLNYAFFALKDLKTPMKISVLLVFLNTVLNALLIGPLKHAGIALSTSICFLIGAALAFYLLKKQLSIKDGKAILKTAFKSLLSAVLMGFIIYWLNNFGNELWLPLSFIEKLLHLSLLAVTGLLCYLLFMRAMKAEEITMSVDFIAKAYKNYISKKDSAS